METQLLEMPVPHRISEAGDGHTWENLAEKAHYRPHDLARAAGVSLRTLQRYFRARYNCTVSDWLRKLRLDQARIRLAHGGKSIKEVAFGLGYKQPSHFTRDFKDRYGIPPRMLLKASAEWRTAHPN